MADKERDNFRSGASDYMANWRDSDLPIHKRTLVAAWNLSKRFRGKQCCDQLGAPGC